MPHKKPGRDYLDGGGSYDSTRESGNGRFSAPSDDARSAKQTTRDVYQCGRGAVGLLALMIAGEGAAIAPNVALGIFFASVKELEQGCGGLLCTAASKTEADNIHCHDALEIIDITKQAGFVLGALLTGSERGADRGGALFAAAGDLADGAKRIAENDILGAIDKAYSLQSHAIEFIDSFKDQSHNKSESAPEPSAEGALEGAAPKPTMPGRGEIDGGSTNSGDLGEGPSDVGGED
ncbi:hypothetical protein [Pseudomonas sp. LB3P58]